MEYICPVLGEGDERDFIAIGQAENFKIAVFTNLDMYHEGCKYLGVTGYEPIKVSDELFKDLAKKDDEFTGIIVNIHNEKKINKACLGCAVLGIRSRLAVFPRCSGRNRRG